MSIIRIQEKTHKFGEIYKGGKKYSIFCSSPYVMMDDESISWASKGFLSYMSFMHTTPKFPEKLFKELLKSGYLVEVKE